LNNQKWLNGNDGHQRPSLLSPQRRTVIMNLHHLIFGVVCAMSFAFHVSSLIRSAALAFATPASPFITR